jgi:hypothetical protein
MNVTFQERLKSVKTPPDPKHQYRYERTEYHPTGLFRLRFENYFRVPIRREWNDTETKRIEHRLREILIALYLAVEAQRLRDEEDRREAVRRAEEEQRRRDRQERERQEREAVEALLSEAKAWEDECRVRAYIKAMDDRKCKDADWFDWARRVATLLDPTKPPRD